MFRIDQPTAAASLPPPAAAGTPGFFTNGNPADNTPATVLDADWANMLQEEFMSTVLGSGQTPSKSTYTQLWTAIKGTKGTGYQKLPSGLVAQWGTLNGSGGVATLTWPIAFPTAVRSVVAVCNGGTPGSVASISVTTANATAASLSCSLNPGAFGGYWIAIGD